MKGKRVVRIAVWILVGVVIAALLGLILGLAVQALWNWLMPAIFGLPDITYWQAVGLFILCHILFKGHHGHHYEHEDKKGRHSHIRERIHELVKGDKNSGNADIEPHTA